MKTVFGIIALAAFFAVSSAPASTSETSPPSEYAQVASITCFLKGEQTSGFNKICYYDCLGSMAAITIGATELCPLNIRQ